MNLPLAQISRVLTFSCVDGPGNRLVLFLQGCNFACPGCHNPHTIGVCNNCGDCIPACPRDALSLRDGAIAFDPAACDGCDLCLRACPISANPMVQHLGPGDVLAMLRENLGFVSGITVSGGEATLQLKFVIALFAAIRAAPDLAGLTCMVDTNGHLGAEAWARLLPVTDGVMLDVKAMDRDRHRALTGRDNDRVLASARIVQAAGKLQELRYLMVPGMNDQEEEIAALIGFARDLGLQAGQAGGPRIRLNAYQHHGVRGPARDWPKMTRDGLEAVAARLRGAGLTEVVTPVVYS